MKEEVKNGRYVDGGGTVRWYKDGQFHREDGPAIEWWNGTKEWYFKGQRHCSCGPAIDYGDGNLSWYLNGLQVTEHEVALLIAKKQLNEKLESSLQQSSLDKKLKI